jgi:hypothetical protein
MIRARFNERSTPGFSKAGHRSNMSNASRRCFG